jgi:hypothetical protein
MADILHPRIEPLSDPNPEPRENPPQNPRAKAAAHGKASPTHVPEISAPEEEDKHDLDEMA